MSYAKRLLAELARQLRLLGTWAVIRRALLETAAMWAVIAVVSCVPWQAFAILSMALVVSGSCLMSGQPAWRAAALYLPHAAQFLVN